MRSPPVLLVDDDDSFASALGERLQRDGIDVLRVRSIADARRRAPKSALCLAVVDGELPDGKGTELVAGLRGADGALVPTVLVTSDGSIDGAVDAIRSGCFDYVSKDKVLPAIASRIKNAIALCGRRRDDGLAGASAAIGALREEVRALAAARDTSVLIAGERGTGKALVARAIHDASERRQHPFVAVDCARLAHRLEEELGGLAHAAAGGTLFLDEIGDLDARAQAKLLCLVLDNEADVRVVSATRRALQDELGRGRFREDLYYRVCVLSVLVPPLREREDDVILLAERFAAERARALGRAPLRLGDDAVAALLDYRFPGNVRELRDAIDHALARLDRGATVLDPSLFPFAQPASPRRGRPRRRVSLADGRRIREAMERSFGNQSKAARALGISRFALKRKLKAIVEDENG